MTSNLLISSLFRAFFFGFFSFLFSSLSAVAKFLSAIPKTFLSLATVSGLLDRGSDKARFPEAHAIGWIAAFLCQFISGGVVRCYCSIITEWWLVISWIARTRHLLADLFLLEQLTSKLTDLIQRRIKGVALLHQQILPLLSVRWNKQYSIPSAQRTWFK